MRGVVSMPLTTSDVPLPASVTQWLGQELEIRGIDAVIYTRYILSILLQDDVEVTSDEADYLPVSTSASATRYKHPTGVDANGRSFSGGQTISSRKVKQRSIECYDLEKLKKSAAVECLLSVTDEESGIETLVDELYMKLKEEQNSSVSAQPAITTDQYESSDSVISTSPDDPTERYYAAFPALSDQCQSLRPQFLTKHAWSEMAQKALASSLPTHRTSSAEQMAADEFPDSLAEFEVLEQEATAAYKMKKTRASSEKPEGRRRDAGAVSRHSSSPRERPTKRGRHGGSQESRIHHKSSHYGDYNVTVGSPREHFVICQPVKTVDQIKGKAVFEDVENESVINKSVAVVLRRGDVTPSPVASNGKKTLIPTVAFIVPKVHLKESKSAGIDNTAVEPSADEELHESRPTSDEADLKGGGEESSGGDDEMKKLEDSEGEENPLWYMGPIPEMPSSPLPKDRLYNRRHSSQDNTDVISHYVREILSEMSGESQLQDDYTVTMGNSPVQGSPSLSSSANTILTLEPVETPIPDMVDDTANETIAHHSVFSHPWGQGLPEPPHSIIAEGQSHAEGQRDARGRGEADTGYIMNGASSWSWDCKKNNDCDSGNETDDQEDKVRHGYSLASAVLNWNHAACEVKQLQPQSPAFDYQITNSGITSEMLITAINNLSSVHPDEMPVELESICCSKDADDSMDNEVHSQRSVASCVCTNTGLSPCSDLSFSSSKLGLDSEQTGIPTPQSTENEVLDDRPVFFLSDDRVDLEQTVGSVYMPQMCSSPTKSSPNRTSPDVLACLSYLWSDSEDEDSDVSDWSMFKVSANKDCSRVEDALLSANSTLTCDNHTSSSDHLILSQPSWSSSPSDSSDIPYNALAPHMPCMPYATPCSASHLGTWPLSDHVWRFPESSFWSASSHDFSSTLIHAWLNREYDASQSSRWPVPALTTFSDTPSFSPHLTADGQMSHIWDINTQRGSIWDSPLEVRPISSLSVDRSISVLMNPHLLGSHNENSRLLGSMFNSGLALLWHRGSNATEIWHSLLFDYTDLMKEDAFSYPFSERGHIFRNASHTSLEGAEFSSTCTLPPYSELHVNGRYIVPSENSAFRRSSISTKRTKPQLKCVGREPLLSAPSMYTSLLAGYDVTRQRLVEVKHLYKSDTSILRQLGLTSESDDDTDQLEYTPDRFFHPIKTPLSSSKESKPSSKPEKSDLSESHTENCECIVAMPSSSYQQYQGDETENVSFIPSFRLKQDHDKCAQTESPGRSAFTQTSLEGKCDVEGGEADVDCSLTERLLQDMRSVLNIGEDEAEVTLVMPALNHSNQVGAREDRTCQGSVYEAAGEELPGQPLVHSDLASLWQDSIQSLSDGQNVSVVSSPQITAVSSSIWASSHLPSLHPSLPVPMTTQDVSPEGSGAFVANDPGLAWSTSEHDLSLNPVDSHMSLEQNEVWSQDAGAVWSVAQEDIPSLQQLPSLSDSKEAFWQQKPPQQTEATDEVFGDDAMQFNLLMFAGGDGSQPLLTEAPFMSDLEENWLDSAQDQFHVQVPNKGQKLGSSKKPCSFFMEGTCRRSDCKFSHDISSITCRFWEDGCCFKGITCPFLHGYAGDSSSGSADVTGNSSPERFQLLNNDFPDLHAAVNADNKGCKTAKKEWRKKKAGSTRSSSKARDLLAMKKNHKSFESQPIDITFTPK